MLELAEKLNREFREKYLNKDVDVLFEREENGFYEGHTRNYIKVLCKAEKDLTNQIVKVKLTKVNDDDTMTGVIE